MDSLPPGEYAVRLSKCLKAKDKWRVLCHFLKDVNLSYKSTKRPVSFVMLFVSLDPGLLRTRSESVQSHRPLDLVDHRCLSCYTSDQRASTFAIVSENIQTGECPLVPFIPSGQRR